MADNGEHDNIEAETVDQFSPEELTDLTALLNALHDVLVRTSQSPESQGNQELMLGLAQYHQAVHYFTDVRIPAIQAQAGSTNLDSELEEFLNGLNG